MKKLQLLVTNPCSENWDEMQPSKLGRYCDTCTKQVVDLTNKSDAALIDFFKNKKANVCGRLLSTQLDRELVAPVQKTNLHWLLSVALGTGIVTVAHAQEIKPTLVQHHDVYPSRPKFQQHLVETTAITDTIKGKVIDENTGKPLAGVKVKRQGFKNVIALTDSIGNFKLSATEEEKANTLIFELDGYHKEETITANNMVIMMNMAKVNNNEPRIMIGAVTTISSSNKPLYIMNAGKNSCTLDDETLKDINPEWIERIEILKDASATALYGSKAANGVILINIKKKYVNKVKFSKMK